MSDIKTKKPRQDARAAGRLIAKNASAAGNGTSTVGTVGAAMAVSVSVSSKYSDRQPTAKAFQGALGDQFPVIGVTAAAHKAFNALVQGGNIFPVAKQKRIDERSRNKVNYLTRQEIAEGISFLDAVQGIFEYDFLDSNKYFRKANDPYYTKRAFDGGKRRMRRIGGMIPGFDLVGKTMDRAARRLIRRSGKNTALRNRPERTLTLKLINLRDRKMAGKAFTFRESMQKKLHVSLNVKSSSIDHQNIAFEAHLKTAALSSSIMSQIMLAAAIAESIRVAALKQSAMKTNGAMSAKIAIQEAVRLASIRQAAVKGLTAQRQYQHAIGGMMFVKACSLVRSAGLTIARSGRVSNSRSVSRNAKSAAKMMGFAASAMFGTTSSSKMQGMMANRMLSGQDAAAKVQRNNKAELNLAVQSGQSVHGRGEQNRQAPVRFSSPRLMNSLSRRGNPHMSPALWCPSSTIDQQGPYAPHIPTDDELFSVAAILERAAGELLVSEIIEQLKLGPAGIENDAHRCKVNAALPERYEAIGRETWICLLRKTLLSSLRVTKAFDEKGIRKPEEVYADAIEILDLDSKLFAEWESHFGIHAMADNLMSFDDIFGMNSESIPEDLLKAIELHLAAIASDSIETGEPREAHQHLFEAKYQWAALCFCGIQDSAQKVSQTSAFVVDLVKKDRLGAGVLLASIVKHSMLSRYRKGKGVLVNQWQADELRGLLRSLMDAAPEIISDKCFRSLIDEWQNSALNKMLYKTNHGDVMKKLRRMGDVPIDRFIDAVEKSDETGKIFRDIVLQMLANHEKFEPTE